MASNKRRPKIYYASQIGVSPPTIMLKCSNPDSFSKTYRRFLLGVLRDHLEFSEIPIRMVLESKKSSEHEEELIGH